MRSKQFVRNVRVYLHSRLVAVVPEQLSVNTHPSCSIALSHPVLHLVAERCVGKAFAIYSELVLAAAKESIGFQVEDAELSGAVEVDSCDL